MSYGSPQRIGSTLEACLRCSEEPDLLRESDQRGPRGRPQRRAARRIELDPADRHTSYGLGPHGPGGPIERVYRGAVGKPVDLISIRITVNRGVERAVEQDAPNRRSNDDHPRHVMKVAVCERIPGGTSHPMSVRTLAA